MQGLEFIALRVFRVSSFGLQVLWFRVEGGHSSTWAGGRAFADGGKIPEQTPYISDVPGKFDQREHHHVSFVSNRERKIAYPLNPTPL